MVLGSRAAALKETFSTTTNSDAEEKFNTATLLAASNKRIEQLEGKLEALERRVNGLANAPKAQCCVIC